LLHKITISQLKIKAMNFSLPPMLLYGIILFAAIATGMENKETNQVPPNVIQIKGRIGLNSDVINGYYLKGDEQHNGRVYYHNQYKSSYVLWNPNSQYWSIDHILDDGRDMAKTMVTLEQDVLFPTLATKYWTCYNGFREWNEDKDIVVEEIDIKDLTKRVILQDPRILTVTLEPRIKLGLEANWTTGTGIKVLPECQEELKQLGTGEDWEILLVDGEPYYEDLLDAKKEGNKSYKLSFIKKLKAYW
jgi:hypothetical protein